MGCADGCIDGALVGCIDGALVGCTVGREEGWLHGQLIELAVILPAPNAHFDLRNITSYMATASISPLALSSVLTLPPT